MDEWITLKEAAGGLQVSERQVLNRIHTGRLKAKRAGRIWLVHGSLSEPTGEEEPFLNEKFALQVSSWVSCTDDLSHIERDFR